MLERRNRLCRWVPIKVLTLLPRLLLLVEAPYYKYGKPPHRTRQASTYQWPMAHIKHARGWRYQTVIFVSLYSEMCKNGTTILSEAKRTWKLVSDNTGVPKNYSIFVYEVGIDETLLNAQTNKTENFDLAFQLVNEQALTKYVAKTAQQDKTVKLISCQTLNII